MLTLIDVINSFLADQQRRLSPNTLRAYRADLMIAAVHFELPLPAITPKQIEAFLADRTIAQATARRRAASLSRLFQWAVREGYVVKNPLDLVEPLPLERRLPRPVPAGNQRKDVAKAIALAPQPYRLIFTLLRETGMRVSEALGLNLGDIILEPGHEGLRVRRAKNKVERIVPLGPNSTPKSLRGLRSHVRDLGSALPMTTPLFTSNRGTRVSYAAAQYQWTQCCRQARLIEDGDTLRYTLHQLRHTRGTELVEEGKSLEIVQRVLGHRDIRSTQGYVDLSEAQVRNALEA